MIKKGLKYESELVVTEEITSIAMNSGDVPVLATPAMIALMENAAMLAVKGKLAEGQTTVGTFLATSHLKPSKVGAKVKAVAKVVGVNDRLISFEIEAYQDGNLIGTGTHQRHIIDKEKFLSRL